MPQHAGPERSNRWAAFSLVEIVLALGIISFALVGIMGLFPVAMKSAQESQRETRAAQIAMQIFNDLRGTPGTNSLIATGTNILTPQLRVNLTTGSTNLVCYDLDGTTIGTNVTADTIFVSEIRVLPNTPMAGVSQVQASIEAPANAPTNARSRYVFVTLMDQR
jgi:uncharacterized protein (TIGR02598 family)